MAKNEIPVFVPITTRESVFGSLKMLLPGFAPGKASVKPRPRYIMRFLGVPVLLIITETFAGIAAYLLFEKWRGAVVFTTVMLLIPTVYMLVVKITAFFTNGIDKSEQLLTLRYNRMYHFHIVIIPRGRVVKYRIRQSLFQRRTGSCDVIIYTKAEFTKSHKVKGLPLDQIKEFII